LAGLVDQKRKVCSCPICKEQLPEVKERTTMPNALRDSEEGRMAVVENADMGAQEPGLHRQSNPFPSQQPQRAISVLHSFGLRAPTNPFPIQTSFPTLGTGMFSSTAHCRACWYHRMKACGQPMLGRPPQHDELCPLSMSPVGGN